MNRQEHNYTKMLKFMTKSLQSFKKGIPRITKPFIDNIDFLIINFPYFTNIDMVYEYFVTTNNEFNSVFRSKIETFLRIQYYNSHVTTVNVDNIRHWKQKDADLYQFLDTASINKMTLWKDILGRSTMDKLKNSWLSYTSNPCKDDHGAACTEIECDNVTTSKCAVPDKKTGISTLNSTEKVLDMFYKILDYHYTSIIHIINNNIDMNKCLEHISINDLLLRRIVSDSKCRYLISGLRNFCNVLLCSGKYDILEAYLQEYDSEFSSSEETSTDVIDFNVLFYKFLTSKNYLDYKLLYNILVSIVDFSNVKIPIYMSLFEIADNKIICRTPKIYLYIRLICHNCETILDEIFDKNLHVQFIDLFFNCKNTQYLHSHIYKFISTSLKSAKYKKTVLNLINVRALSSYKDGFAKYVSGRPHIDNIFSYCYLLEGRDTMFYRLDHIKHSDITKINDYIEDCFDESFVRYVCQLVIDEVPVLNVLRKD